MNAAADDPGVWGGLTVAGMSLALPLQSLREVVALQPLRPLPCASPAIAGGLLLRGVTVPVLDLARLLGHAVPAAAPGCVVTVVHEGRLLGLLAERVDGIFFAESLSSAEAGGDRTLFGGSLRRRDTGATLDRLALPALAARADLPWIDDPEPQRARPGSGAAAAADAAPDTEALMLVRSGGLALAIEALAVQATLWSPRIAASALARGACRGTVQVNGRRVAAVDLLALCGLGAAPARGAVQALVLAHPDGGALALLVEHVLDIVTVPRSRLAPLPSAGGVPLRAVLDGEHCDHLVLDVAALAALDEARQLAAAGDHGSVATGGPAAAGAGDAVITLRLDRELAVPMDQVQEILPYGDRDAMFGDGLALRRIQVLRGRALPVYCLARLGGGLPGPAEASASVLVVSQGDRLVGFGVPALRAIETVRSERRLPIPPQGPAGQRVVTVGRPGEGTERSLQVVDLQALAAGLVDQPLGAAA